MKKAERGDAPRGRKRRAGAAPADDAEVEVEVAAAQGAVAPAAASGPPPSVLVEAPAGSQAAADADPLAEFFVSDAERERMSRSFASEGAAGGSTGRVTLELLGFWVAEEEYALAIVEVQEIIKVPTVTELPRAHPAVLGIISLRGTIVPVIDLRRILRLEERALTRQTRILVVRAADDPVGLLVDRVTSVVRLEADKIEPTPRAMQRQSSDILRGVGRVGARLIIVLDVNAVMDVMDNAA